MNQWRARCISTNQRKQIVLVSCHSGKLTRLIELGMTSLAEKINQFHSNTKPTVMHSKFLYRPMKIVLNLQVYILLSKCNFNRIRGLLTMVWNNITYCKSSLI